MAGTLLGTAWIPACCLTVPSLSRLISPGDQLQRQGYLERAHHRRHHSFRASQDYSGRLQMDSVLHVTCKRPRHQAAGALRAQQQCCNYHSRSPWSCHALLHARTALQVFELVQERFCPNGGHMAIAFLKDMGAIFAFRSETCVGSPAAGPPGCCQRWGRVGQLSRRLPELLQSAPHAPGAAS